MKIAIYYDVPAGGASRTMEEQIRLLEKSHEVSVFHNLSGFNSPLLPRLFADLESLVFQKFRQRKQARDIDDQKYDIVYVSHDRHSQAPWILRFLETPTIFLCQEPTRAYFEEFLRIDSNLPLVNRIYETINRYFRKKVEISNAHYATVIVANSVYSSESIFRAYGLLSKPIHLGIDTKEYFPERVVRKNQFLVVGNHEPQKALPFAIEIISKIDKKTRPKLVIASPRNWDISGLTKMAKKLHIDLDIIIGLDQAKLRKIYCQSKLTLAVAHLEPFGLSVVESMACGTPVVAVNEGGFKETVIHGVTGLLIERDSTIIADALGKLLRDKEKLLKMGENGVKESVSNFTWQKNVSELEIIFYENRRHHRKLS